MIRPVLQAGAALALLGACSSVSAGGAAPGAPSTAPAGTAAGAADDPLRTARVNGVELHYVERGAGEPVVFLHGALMDYREWLPVAERLDGYRAIAYSRRYNHPNDNPLAATDHSALVEAEDLAALIRELGAAPTHVVGLSYGGFTALALALRHPELVRSLVLVEPALIGWLPDLPGGAPLYEEFYTGTWQGAGHAFERGDTAQALRVTLDFFAGPGVADRLPAEFRALLLSNIREWEALTTSTDPFPLLTPEQVRRLEVPVLVLSGGRSYPMLQAIDAELERLLPAGSRVVVPDATHDLCTEQPDTCAAAIREFLATRSR
jgi:pimeloyl-ACP methyl ester carboxylesterase